MSDERKDLPPVTAPNFLEKLREAMQTYLGTRGDITNRGLVVGDLVDIGLVTLRPGVLAGTGGRRNPVAGAGPAVSDAYEIDLTPPPAPASLSATTSGTSIQVTIAPQTYRQGHGPAKVIVFGAKYLTGDPLPTYADAAVLDEFFGDIHAFPADQASLYRLWAKSESADGVESSVAGGTNGVAPVPGLLDDVSIASLSASKIRSGTVTVGQYIQSAGYVPNVTGWRIDGDGTIRAINCVLAGTIYASAGTIGGVNIAANAVWSGQSSFNSGSGFYLGASGVLSLGNSAGNRLTWDGTNIEIISPKLTLQNGAANFSGNLNAANITGATGEFGGTLRAGVVDLSMSVGVSAEYGPGTHTLTVPTGKTSLRATLLGGGGGGGGGSNRALMTNFLGAGGGGGGYVNATYDGLTPGATYTLVVGAGGAGGETRDGTYTAGSDGAVGGDTYVTGLVLASGGGGGGVASNTATGGAAGGTGATAGSFSTSETFEGGTGGNSKYGTGGAGASAAAQVVAGVGGRGAGGGGGGGSGSAGASYSGPGTVSGAGGGGFAIIEFFDKNGVILRTEYTALKVALNNQGITTP